MISFQIAPDEPAPLRGVIPLQVATSLTITASLRIAIEVSAGWPYDDPPVLIYTELAAPDADGIVQMDLAPILREFFKPQAITGALTWAYTETVSFSIEVYERTVDDDTPLDGTESWPLRRAYFGGADIITNNTYDGIALDKWLTWHPSGRTVNFREFTILSFNAPDPFSSREGPDTPLVKIFADLYLAAGSESTSPQEVLLHSFPEENWQPGCVLHLATGFIFRQFQALLPGETITHYTIRVEYSDDYEEVTVLIPPYTFTMDYRQQKQARSFIYMNTLGGYDSILCTGELETALPSTATQGQIAPLLQPGLQDSTDVALTAEAAAEYDILLGNNKSVQELDIFQDFFRSFSRLLILKRGNDWLYLPIAYTGKGTNRIYRDRTPINPQGFTFRLRRDVQLYSGQLITLRDA